MIFLNKSKKLMLFWGVGMKKMEPRQQKLSLFTKMH